MIPNCLRNKQKHLDSCGHRPAATVVFNIPGRSGDLPRRSFAAKMGRLQAANTAYRSTTDPEASIISRDGGKRRLAYKDHRVVDNQCGVILETQATPAAVAEGTLLPSLIDRVCRQTFYLRAVAADKSYGHAANFRYLWEQHITAHLARARSPRRKPGVFGKEQFTYVPDEDVSVCPAGERLSAGRRKVQHGSREYQAPKHACVSCALRAQCLSGRSARRLRRRVDEAYVTLIRSGPVGQRWAMRRRKAVVEGSFADAKAHRGHRRSRWRGLMKMQIQCHLVAAVQNFLKLIKPMPKRAAEGRQRVLRNVGPCPILGMNRLAIFLLEFFDFIFWNPPSLSIFPTQYPSARFPYDYKLLSDINRKFS